MTMLAIIVILSVCGVGLLLAWFMTITAVLALLDIEEGEG